MLKIYLTIFTFFCLLCNGQGYSDYRMQYDNYEENDERAFKFLKPYIKKAKDQGNYRELAQAYKDAVSFSKNQKLAYADSAIVSATKTGDNDIVGNAYLTKGTVYYFNYKKFSPALDEYLKGWQFLEHSKDQYLHFKNLYHIGVVKRYLGYYQQSLDIFEKCIDFYDNQLKNDDANTRFNMKKGYLNSLHQSVICLNELDKYKDAQKRIKIGLAKTAGDLNFYLERSYFFKTKGVAEFYQGKYNDAITSFRNALSGIEKKDDFASASLIYYYKGKSLLKIRENKQAFRNFQRVDSIFVNRTFVLPEVRSAYELLIDKSKTDGDVRRELYYTSQLLKVDKVITSDYKYLASKLFKEFDTKDLINSKSQLENSIFYGYITVGLIVITSIIVWTIFFIKRKKQKALPNLSGDNKDHERSEIFAEDDTLEKAYPKLPEKLVEDILAKLMVMENQKAFLEKGVTLNRLAKKFKTNTSYLSAIINEHKGKNFNAYLNTLRIEFAAKMIIENKIWRSYSVETIASECGFTNRTNFSKIFTDIIGMSPSDFIQHHKEIVSNDRD